MNSQQLPKNTKTIEIFLIVLGIGALILGFLRLNSTIIGSFNNNQDNRPDNVLKRQEQDLSSLIELQTKDTDQDGLSDYDELNVYHTGIYLADSDSDGFTDKEEIDSGNDPNCPKDMDCSIPDQAGQKDKKPSTVFDEFEEVDFEEYKNIIIDSETGEMEDLEAEKMQRIMSGEATLSEVKEMLLNSGMSKQDLDKIPDSDIMKMYIEMVNES